MIPVSVYCRRCGGYVKEEMREDSKDISNGEHRHLEDCVKYLKKRLDQLESKDPE